MSIFPENSALRNGIQILMKDEDDNQRWISPNDGKYPLTVESTFMNRYTSASRVFRANDEAIIDSRDNARFMMNDLGIRECLDARRRQVSGLNWHLEPEDSKSHDQKGFCEVVEKAIRRIRNFTEYRYSVQFGIWYGRSGVMHRWRPEVIGNQSVYIPKGIHQDDLGWRPIHGDKLVWRMDRPQMVPGAYSGQLGIRVGWMDHKAGDVLNGRWRIEATDYGLAYFLSPAERRTMLVHKHHIEDAAYEDGLRAGSINGVGIRSVIYWEWVQKQELTAFLVEFVERMAGGVQMWKYPQGNQQALAEMKNAAENYNSGKEHIMLVPIPMGENGNQYGVEHADWGFHGIESLQNLIKDYFNDRVKRYILGQTLSSEAGSTGLGSGVAELHMDTLLQIIKADATNHEETMTYELIAALIKINVDKKVWQDPGFQPKFVCETEEADVEAKLASVTQLMDRKIKFIQSDLYDLVGMAMPGPTDQVNPDIDEAPANPTAPSPKNDKPKEEGGEAAKKEDDVAARDDNAANNGHPSEHVQRYSRRSFTIPAGWKKRKKGNK